MKALQERTTSIGSKIPLSLLQQFKHRCRLNNTSMAQEITNAMREYLKSPLIYQECSGEDFEQDLEQAKAIMELCRKQYNLSEGQFYSHRRYRHIIAAKHLAMYFIYEYYRIPLRQIGKMMGLKNHTTVIMGCRRVKYAIETKTDVYEAYLRLNERIQQEIIQPLKKTA